MDLFSRKIIAWTLSETLEVSCVIDTINKAKARRNIDQPLIIHSDRGSQYVATEYKKATENMQRSYSKKAFPWDNPSFIILYLTSTPMPVRVIHPA